MCICISTEGLPGRLHSSGAGRRGGGGALRLGVGPDDVLAANSGLSKGSEDHMVYTL